MSKTHCRDKGATAGHLIIVCVYSSNQKPKSTLFVKRCWVPRHAISHVFNKHSMFNER
jgi:hypothetical protein